jgi:hypothetical protein
MKSSKQRRIELKEHKQVRADKLTAQAQAARAATKAAEKLAASEWAAAHGGVAIDRTAFAPNSWDEPDFVKRGYYLDLPFTCAGCNSQEIWTAAQQKWWYEEAKGNLYSTAKFCRPCRHQEQSRRAEARRIHLEGIAKKQHSI